MAQSDVININIKSFLSKHYIKISIILLILIVILGIYIRTSNISNLKDITTGEYTLGPDLDPFLYLRHANEIANNTLKSPDMMRGAPLGNQNYAYASLMPWVIFYLYKFLNIFSSTSIEYSAIILPVILTSFAIIFFFLFVQKAFSFLMQKSYSYYGAVLASLLYAVANQMLHRTTAGIPEIESLGMVFFWLAFYCFLSAWESNNFKKYITLSIISGLSTGAMIWTWGGYKYIFMTFFLATFISFLFNNLQRKHLIVYSGWLIPAVIINIIKNRDIFSTLNSISDILPSLVILLFLLVNSFNLDSYIRNKIKLTKDWPKQFISILITIIALVILVSILFGPMFVPNKISSIITSFIHPFGYNRVGFTVAENKVPYVTDIINSFSVQFLKINLSLFWTFLFGSLLLFYFATKHLDKKYKIAINSIFIIFLFGFIFSRISSISLLDGENFISKLLYFGSLIFFIFAIFFVYIKERNNLENTFNKINFSYILLISLIFFSIIFMRSAIRFLFLLAAPFIIASCYLLIKSIESIFSQKENKEKRYAFIILALIAGIFILSFAYGNAQRSYTETKYTVPGQYEQQWQKAMDWVRNNTSQDAIFVHWWDYGYWIQSIGHRPTLTDGGHPNFWFTYNTARYILTSPRQETALSMFKSLNISYLLIDSTDIGKYSAYASIGSDQSGTDRLSYITTFTKDDRQTLEKNNKTTYVYTNSQFVLDQDLIINENGTNLFLPSGKSAVIGTIIEVNQNEKNLVLSQPKAVFITQNSKQILLPLRYLYVNNKLMDFNSGVEAGIVVIPSLLQTSNGGVSIDNFGSTIYLSNKTFHSQLAQLYIMNQTNNNIKLAHLEDDNIVKILQQNNVLSSNNHFVYYGGIRGPIKIFDVRDYADNISIRPEFVNKYTGDLNTFNWASLDNLDFSNKK